jgi:threonine/homoserine efflux transporter RhtA
VGSGSARGGGWTVPIIVVVALSAVSLVVAILASRAVADVWWWSAAAYGIVLVISTAAIFWSRLGQIRRTRQAGRTGVFGIGSAERIALGASIVGCAANVINFAIEVSTMDFWPTWLTELGR